MKKIDKGRVYALLAALSFVFYVIDMIIPEIKAWIDTGYHGMVLPDAELVALMICLLFNTRRGAGIAVGILCLMAAWICVLEWRQPTEEVSFLAAYLMLFFCFAFLFVTIILSVKQRPIVRKIWFVSTLFWVAFILLTPDWVYMRNNTVDFIMSFLWGLPLPFVGLWLRESVPKPNKE